MPSSNDAARKGSSPATYRQGHLVKSTKLQPSMFVDVSEELFDSSSPRVMLQIIGKVEKQLQAAKDKLRRKEAVAKRELFKTQPGSSRDHANLPQSPPKKKRARSFQPPPDCGLPHKHPQRDGHRSSHGLYSDTPPKHLLIVD